MNFDEWWEKESGWGGERLAEYNLAKEAWNKAVDLTSEYFCDCEGTDHGVLEEFTAN